MVPAGERNLILRFIYMGKALDSVLLENFMQERHFGGRHTCMRVLQATLPGLLLPQTLFLLAISTVFHAAFSGRRNAIQWTVIFFSKYLDYADYMISAEFGGPK